MPDWLVAVILGIVEGVTEFLPVSSTGHLIIAGEILGLSDGLKNTFEIVIQIGAVIAVMGFYWAELLQQARSITTDVQVQRFWLGILIAFAPAALIGLLLHNIITQYLFAPIPIAIALILGGFTFLYLEYSGIAEKTESNQDVQHITLKQALIIGCFQTFALIPGVSRSGASIIGGIFSGLSRKVATQFSFYLAIPTLGAATVYQLSTSLSALSGNMLLHILVGTIVSGFVAWLSIGWLLRYVAHNRFTFFGYYRILVGIVIWVVFGVVVQ